MAKLLPYPHYVINVDDQSRYDDAVAEEYLGLHVPLFFGKYAKGPANVPVWCEDTNSLYRIFGKEWTNNATDYFTEETFFVEANFSRQAGFVCRLVPEDAKTASILLEAHVTTGTDVQMYERNQYGVIVKDDNGDPKPLLDASNQPVTEAGLKIKWTARALDPNTESRVKSIKPTTTDNGDGTTTTVYPVMAVVSKSAGAYGSNTGFRFYYDPDQQQSDRIATNKALEFSFAAMELDYTSNTPTYIRNRWNNAATEFMIKPKQYDNKVMQNLSYEEVIENNYVADKPSELPYEIYFFEDYVKDIGAAVQAVETNDANLTDPFMVNIFSMTNLDDIQYHHVDVDTSAGAIFFSKSYTIYLQDGDDGSTDRDNYEEMIRHFLEMKTFPRLKDKFKFPLTHLYDTGYSNTTKEALITFLGERDDVRVELATQDISNELNDESEDQSIGLYLRTRALMQVESTVKGTDCCRCGIYAHSGKLYDTRYTGYVPTTLDILTKRCRYQSTGYISGEPKARPRSEVTIFKSLNWTAYDEDNKALFWDSGINYIQHYDRTGFFWPDLRTVYTSDTSVLSEWTFVDAIVYTKHFIRKSWTYFTGSTDPVTELYTAIEKRINTYLHDAFNGRYGLVTKAWRSEEDAKLGYLVRITLYITGRNSARVWEADIVTLKDETVVELGEVA